MIDFTGCKALLPLVTPLNIKNLFNFWTLRAGNEALLYLATEQVEQ